jgi:branched-chain amino acid transport system substrate-binding protein
MGRRALIVTCLAALALTMAFGGRSLMAAKEGPIKIGAFFALSGPASGIGTPTKLVAEMVVDKINKEGGINGRMIELVLGDTESEPTKAVMVFKKFTALDRVAAVIGPTRTDTGMAVKRQVEAAKVPTVMTVGGDPVIMEGRHGTMDFGSARYVFKTPQRSSTAVEKVLGHLQAQGLTRVAVLSASDSFGKDGLQWLERLAPEFGVTIVASETFNPTDVDMKTQLTKIARLNPQAVVCWTIGPAGAIVSRNHHSMGMKALLVQCHGLAGPSYIELAGAAAEGNLMPATKLMVWESLPDSDPQKPVIAEFVHLYNEVYGYSRHYPINTHSGYAWDAVYLLVNAMREVGTDPERLREALERTKGYVGVSGVFTLSPEDHNGLSTDSLVMLRVENGRFVLAE